MIQLTTKQARNIILKDHAIYFETEVTSEMALDQWSRLFWLHEQ